MISYTPASSRYAATSYRRCGRSGLLLPPISLGLWHNFGDVDDFDSGRALVRRAFDLGITHFDLANNYGPPPGSAESNFGRILKADFLNHRDELIISTKAGYAMSPGPYGDGGSRKYLIASLDASLERLGLKYVDIFYHHRQDPRTPLEETLGALDYAVRSGRALYAGISNYGPADTRKAVQILRALGTPCLIHQPSYSLLNRWVEEDLLDVLGDEGVGCIAFSPLSQGLLTNRYLSGIPRDSRVSKGVGFLRAEHVTAERVSIAPRLNELASQRNQTLAQFALAWVLRDPRVTSALIGASKISQLEDAVGAVANVSFTPEELRAIDAIVGDAAANR